MRIFFPSLSFVVKTFFLSQPSIPILSEPFHSEPFNLIKTLLGLSCCNEDGTGQDIINKGQRTTFFPVLFISFIVYFSRVLEGYLIIIFCCLSHFSLGAKRRTTIFSYTLGNFPIKFFSFLYLWFWPANYVKYLDLVMKILY